MASKEQLSLEYTMFCYKQQDFDDGEELARELSKLIIAEALEPSSSKTLSFLVNALATICEEFVGSFCKVDDPVTYFNKQYCKVIRETYDENKEACTSNWNDDWPEDANWRTHELNRIARLEAGKWIHDMEYFRNMALAKEK